MYLLMFDLPIGWLLAVGIVACGMAYVVEEWMDAPVEERH